MTPVTLSDINIRNSFKPGDLGYIAYLHGDLYAKECGYGMRFEEYVLEGLKNFAKGYASDKDRVWICEHEGNIIGSLFAQQVENKVQFRFFILEPKYRGIGLGKHLMQLFLDFMTETGAGHCFLWTTEDQLTAVGLYTRFGFKLTNEKTSGDFDKPVREFRYDLIITH